MKKNLTSLLLAGLVMGLGSSLVCAGTPVLGPTGHYYDLVQQPLIDWDSAFADAGALSFGGMGGHLVTITSAAEDQFVIGLVYGWQDTTGNMSPPQFWLGGLQQPLDEPDKAKGWTWINGEGAFPGDNNGPVYANWGDGEPNDAFVPGFEQHLAIGYRTFSSGAWNDEGWVENIQGYLVEYESQSVPEQGSLGWLTAMTFAGLALASRQLQPRRQSLQNA
jgi:hypothetical protein